MRYLLLMSALMVSASLVTNQAVADHWTYDAIGKSTRRFLEKHLGAVQFFTECSCPSDQIGCNGRMTPICREHLA